MLTYSLYEKYRLTHQLIETGKPPHRTHSVQLTQFATFQLSKQARPLLPLNLLNNLPVI